MKRRFVNVLLSTALTVGMLTQSAVQVAALELPDGEEILEKEIVSDVERGISEEGQTEEETGEQTEDIVDENGEENQEDEVLTEETDEDTISEEEETEEETDVEEEYGIMLLDNEFIPDEVPANTVVDWKFDSDYIKSGSLETNDLIIYDASGNGNDLQLNTERVPAGKNAGNYISFSADDIYGNEGIESIYITPENTGNSGKKKGAFFETVAGAPMNDEEFTGGYTIEVILKVPQQLCAWSSIFGQKGTGKLAGMVGGEPEANGGLNISSSGELQWNPWTTNNAEIQDNPTTWSDAGGVQREKWHHVVIKNDGHSTVMIVDGIQVQRCNTFEDQVGIKSLNVGGQKAWVVGTAYWSGASSFSEASCGDAIFKGYIQEIRMSKGTVDPSDYLVTEHVVDDRYQNLPGDNDPYPELANEDNYTFVNIPDPQYQTQYKPEIVDSQIEWIRDNAEKLNIAMSLCVGDLSQDGTAREFERANQAFSLLDEANLPYLVVDGNHDGNEFKTLFSGSRYEGDTGYQGTGPSGVSSYSIIRAGSYEYLFLSLPWGYRDGNGVSDLDKDREWILNVLDTHRDYPTIVFSHFNTNIDTFVKPYDQIFMTVRGHVTYRGISSFKNNAGHDVIDVVTNYQFDLYGGNGWLSTMEFDESANTVTLRSYSPWVEKKMKIISGEIENNGVLLADEMQLFPFDKLSNRLSTTSGSTDDTVVLNLNFKERFPSGTLVSMENTALKADMLKEKIDAANRVLENANELQYTEEDLQALKNTIEDAEAFYTEYEAITSVTPLDKISALEENMIAAKNKLIDAMNAFEDAAKPVTEIKVIGGDFEMNVNETKQLSVVVGPEEAVTKDVIWTSSNESVAVVDEAGAVTSLKEGIAVITASTIDGSNLKAFAFVTVKQPAKGVAISKDKAALKVGETLQLSAKVTEGTNKGILWVSSNPDIASVDQFGLVTAVKEGNVEIAAVAEDGKGAYAICAITVSDKKDSAVIKDTNNTTNNNTSNKTAGQSTSTTTKTTSLQTGDQNLMGILMAAMLLTVSFGAIVTLVLKKKKFR